VALPIRADATRCVRLLSLQLAANDPQAVGIGKRANGRQVVMLVLSDLRIDPRVEREARSLAKAGYVVTVICPEPFDGAANLIQLEWGPNVGVKFIDRAAAEFASYRPGYAADIFYSEAVKYRPFAFHAHDLNVAYAALGAARETGSHLIVDFHEWFSENVYWSEWLSRWVPYPAAWKSDLQRLESRCLLDASATITVCDSIADAMVNELGGARPHVIRNIPASTITGTREYLPLKQELQLPDSCFLLLWQGGTGPTRLIEPIIEALAYAPRCVFVIRGPSLDLFGEAYKTLARRIGAEDRLILLAPVPSRDVVAAARGADAGIWTLPALCRNFTYALPNKIFEYMAAGLPILAAHYPEAKRLVADNNIGITFDPNDPKSIASAINLVAEDRSLSTRFRRNVEIALNKISTEDEWQKLVRIYDNLPRTAAPN